MPAPITVLVIDSYTQEGNLIDLLGLDRKQDADLCEIIKKILPDFRTLINLPIYTLGSTGANLEAYAQEYNLEFPKTDIETFRELGCFLYQAYVTGDENYGIFSAEYVLLTATLSTILNKLFENLSGEEYALLLNFLTKKFNLRSLDNFNSYAGDYISKIEGVNLFVSALGSTVLLLFTTDELPSDNDAVLPGYASASAPEKNLNIFEKISNFFKAIIEYLRRLFGIGQ